MDHNRELDTAGFLELATIRLSNTIASKHKKYVESYTGTVKGGVFGQGPGASPMSLERRDQIDRHLATCRECEQFVATLEVPLARIAAAPLALAGNRHR